MIVYGGIITYQPDISRLQDNVAAMVEQVDKLIIIDNGSCNQNEIIRICMKYSEKIDLYLSDINWGISMGLYALMKYAELDKADWVLSVDQDSIINRGLIDEYKKYIQPGIGIITCGRTDRNYTYDNGDMSKCVDVDYCITAGCMMNVGVYFRTSGYDVELFIDYVDFDICFKIRELNYRIIRIPYIGFIHEYGNGVEFTCAGIKLLINGHKAWREYYKARNYIVLRKKHKKFVSFYQTIRHEFGMYIKILVGEKNKMFRFKMVTKGVIDGCLNRMKYNPLNYEERGINPDEGQYGKCNYSNI